MKEFFKKKWVRRSIIILIIIVVIVLIFGNKPKQTTVRTDTVARGDLEIAISGSGTMEASESRTEISKVSAKVKKINYIEGDTVESGYVIAEMDDGDYRANVESQRTSIKQAELNKQNIDRQIKALEIIAPTSGYVSNLTALENNYINSTMQVCSIIASNKYEVTLQFVANDANPIALHSKANVMLVNTMNYITGEVTFVGQKKYIVDGGVQVIDVIIEADHPTYSLEGSFAKADVATLSGSTISSVNQATFKGVEGASVIANTSGTLKTLYVKNGQYVNIGEKIALLENKDLVLSAETSALSIKNAYTQLKYAEDKLNDYKIIAPINGRITKFDLKLGDQVSLGSVLATVSNENSFEFQIPVDELDIAKIDYDKEVLVTIDAISDTQDNPLKGKITKMPLQGVTVGGVTDYYVTISVEGRNDIKISMNANAKILISKAEDVLYIPLEALSKENGESYVEVQTENGVEKRSVVTGLSNVSYIEIKEGLKEGEKVVVPELGTGFNFMMGG